MGFVPPVPPDRPPWMTDEQWRAVLKQEIEMCGRMLARGSARALPLYVVALPAMVAGIAAIAGLILG